MRASPAALEAFPPPAAPPPSSLLLVHFDVASAAFFLRNKTMAAACCATGEATFADSLFPEFCSGEPASLVQSGNSLCSQGEGGLEGVRRINYDLPV